jgi:hypothetical protein
MFPIVLFFEHTITVSSDNQEGVWRRKGLEVRLDYCTSSEISKLNSNFVELLARKMTHTNWRMLVHEIKMANGISGL